MRLFRSNAERVLHQRQSCTAPSCLDDSVRSQSKERKIFLDTWGHCQGPASIFTDAASELLWTLLKTLHFPQRKGFATLVLTKRIDRPLEGDAYFFTAPCDWIKSHSFVNIEQKQKTTGNWSWTLVNASDSTDSGEEVCVFILFPSTLTVCYCHYSVLPTFLNSGREG